MTSRAQRLLTSLAWLFTGATLLYAGVWLYTVRLQPQARAGIESRYSRPARAIRVEHVDEGSPAAPDPSMLLRSICGDG